LGGSVAMTEEAQARLMRKEVVFILRVGIAIRGSYISGAGTV